jgi:Na+-transporting methylmalonyl-CoA/oxaloacetate decarboxylase gamma subunit
MYICYMKIFLLICIVVAYFFGSAIVKASKECINDSMEQSTKRITTHMEKKIYHKLNQIVEGN